MNRDEATAKIAEHWFLFVKHTGVRDALHHHLMKKATELVEVLRALLS